MFVNLSSTICHKSQLVIKTFMEPCITFLDMNIKTVMHF